MQPRLLVQLGEPERTEYKQNVTHHWEGTVWYLL